VDGADRRPPGRRARGRINGVLICLCRSAALVVTLSMLRSRALRRRCAVRQPDCSTISVTGAPGTSRSSGGGQNFALDFPPVRLSNPSSSSFFGGDAGRRAQDDELGPHVFAIGGNEQAANLTACRSKRVRSRPT